MPILDTRDLPEINNRPGWHGRVFHSESMTFVHWAFDAGAIVHEHTHDHEEVWHVLAGELEFTIDGAAQVAGPDMVAIIPAGESRALRALRAGRAIAVEHPPQDGF